MGKTYSKPTPDCLRIVAETLDKYHPALAEIGLRIDVLMVHAPRDAEGHATGPALQSKSGAPAAACVSVVKLKDRVKGAGDAEILFDGDRYPKWKERTIAAIADHEIEHLEFDGKVDDIGRPKLKLRPHDVEFGWFDAIARRHGDASVEVLQAKRVFGCRSLRQLYLPGWEDELPAEARISPSITRTVAAKFLNETFEDSLFGQKIDPKALAFVTLPVWHDGKATTIEAWVDPLERAVLFTEGEIMESRPKLQLSSLWMMKQAEAAES